jgi:hypothetical protein
MVLPNPDDRLVGGVNCLARFDLQGPASGKKAQGGFAAKAANE